MVQVQGYSEDEVELLALGFVEVMKTAMAKATAQTAASLQPALHASARIAYPFHLPGKHDQSTHGARGSGTALADFYGDKPYAAADRVWGGTYGGLTSRTSYVGISGAPGDGVVSVQGSVFDADGNEVGGWHRNIHMKPGQPTYITHSELQLVPQAQRHGFATEFNEHAYASYREMGVDHVKITAVNRGKVSWALSGFDFANEGVARETSARWLHQAKRHIASHPELQPGLDALEHRIKHGRYGTLGDEGMPTPHDLASFGRTPGAKEWLGADAMMGIGDGWSGVLMMSDFL